MGVLFAHVRPAIRGSGQAALEAVAELVAREDVVEIIVGLPLSLDGSESGQTAAARRFAAKLRIRLALTVTEWDERLSSVEAGRSVGGPARRRSGQLDSAAAAVVLQVVLDACARAVTR